MARYVKLGCVADGVFIQKNLYQISKINMYVP